MRGTYPEEPMDLAPLDAFEQAPKQKDQVRRSALRWQGTV
jgi:hypothetical protein